MALLGQLVLVGRLVGVFGAEPLEDVDRRPELFGRLRRVIKLARDFREPVIGARLFGPEGVARPAAG